MAENSSVECVPFIERARVAVSVFPAEIAGPEILLLGLLQGYLRFKSYKLKGKNLGGKTRSKSPVIVSPLPSGFNTEFLIFNQKFFNARYYIVLLFVGQGRKKRDA